MSTLANRKNSHVLFSSESIPGEIIDSVVMAKNSLEKAGGKNAACAIADAYYTLSKILAQKDTQDKALVALGKKFSNLDADQMKTVVRQTRFYATPEMGISFMEGGVVFPWKKTVEDTSDLFTNAGFDSKSSEVTAKTLKELMPFVVKFCVDKEMTPESPVISYGKAEEGTQLLFDSQYMKAVLEKNK